MKCHCACSLKAHNLSNLGVAHSEEVYVPTTYMGFILSHCSLSIVPVRKLHVSLPSSRISMDRHWCHTYCLEKQRDILFSTVVRKPSHFDTVISIATKLTLSVKLPV